MQSCYSFVRSPSQQTHLVTLILTDFHECPCTRSLHSSPSVLLLLSPHHSPTRSHLITSSLPCSSPLDTRARCLTTMKTPSFASLQDGKDKIIYPCQSISSNSRMMHVLAEVQEHDAQAAQRKREKFYRRILIGVVFVITSLIMAIFIASVATYVILYHTNWYRGSSSPRALPLIVRGRDLRTSVNSLPILAKQVTDKSSERSRVMDMNANKTKESQPPVTTPAAIKVEESPKDKSIMLDEVTEDTTELVDLITTTPSSMMRVSEEVKVDQENTQESNKVISVARSTTVAPKRGKSAPVSSASYPSSSSLFGLGSRSSIGYRSPYVTSTLTLDPTTRSTSPSGVSGSLVPAVTSWSLQMMSTARNWLQNRGFLGE